MKIGKKNLLTINNFQNTNILKRHVTSISSRKSTDGSTYTESVVLR